MKELQAILEAWSTTRAAGRRAALATLVKVEGSSYRRAGARMLISEDGTLAGGISGGCLEADVIEIARQVIAADEPRLLCYDSTDERDLILGTGLGCNGVVHILVQPLHAATATVLDSITACLASRRPGAIATVFRNAEGLAFPGSHLMLQEGGAAISQFNDADLTSHLTAAAAQTLREGATRNYKIEVRGWCLEALVEVLMPPPPLVIFGAGSDAMPVVRLAKELGWHVTVVDERPAHASALRFPATDAVVQCAVDDVSARVPITAETLALVMTHNFVRDLELLRVLLPSPARYIGVLGPRRRTERILTFLAGDGIVVDEQQQARLHSPVGLDIGADTPEEIALSIVAEIKAFLTGHDGGSLRHRASAIHSFSA